MNNDTDLIFEAYATQVANEGIGDLLVKGGSAVARQLGKTNIGRKLLGSAGNVNKTGQLQNAAGKFMSKGQEAAQVGKRIVAPAAGAAVAGGALTGAALDKRENVSGAPAGAGTTTMGVTIPSGQPSTAGQQGGRAFGPSGIPKRPVEAGNTAPSNNVETDVFKKFHGTSYNPNSDMDRKKMEHIQGLQKAGTPLTSTSVYGANKAAAPAAPAAPAASDNPPGTMLSRGLARLGKGLGNLKFKSPDREMMPYGGAGPTSASLPRPINKPSYKPLFSKGGVFNK